MLQFDHYENAEKELFSYFGLASPLAVHGNQDCHFYRIIDWRGEPWSYVKSTKGPRFARIRGSFTSVFHPLQVNTSRRDKGQIIVGEHFTLVRVTTASSGVDMSTYYLFENAMLISEEEFLSRRR